MTTLVVEAEYLNTSIIGKIIDSFVVGAGFGMLIGGHSPPGAII